MTRESCRAACAALVVVLCLVLGARAQAQVGVHVDCHLETGPIECRALENAFERSMGSSITRASAEPAPAVALRVRAVGLASSTRYEVATRAGTQTLAMVEVVPEALGRDPALLRVLSLLERSTLPFLPIESAEIGDDGSLRLRTRQTTRTTAAESADDDEPFYLRPSLSGELVQQGVSLLSLTAELEASWSDADWRVLTKARTRYRHLRIDIPGAQRLEGSAWEATTSGVLARTIDGGLGMALLAEAGRAPQNNLDHSLKAGIGVEWVRVPIRRDEESNCGVRYRMHAVSHDYVSENVYGESERVFARHSVTAFASWHTEAVDFGLVANGGMVLDRPEAWDVSGEHEITWRVTDAFEITLSSWLTYRGVAVHQPRDPDGLDPIAVIVSGSDFGQLSYGGELGFSYVFGNELRHARDQRWR